MPELPEVETTRRGLAQAMQGQTIARVDLRRGDLRYPFTPGFQQLILGRRVERVDRRAKYLILRLSGNVCLVAHLGMSGSFRVERDGGSSRQASLYRETTRYGAHDHVAILMSDGTSIVYNDPRRFGFMFVAPGDELAAHPRMRGIGLEPLEPPVTAAVLVKALSGSTAPLKAVLLDQTRIAGLGNIYVCEALHRSGLSPFRSAASIVAPDAASRTRAARLSKAIRQVLVEAIDAGGSTLRDFSGADGKPGYFQHSFRVYDREGAGCPRRGCHGTIMRSVQAGRSTFHCPECQT